MWKERKIIENEIVMVKASWKLIILRVKYEI